MFRPQLTAAQRRALQQAQFESSGSAAGNPSLQPRGPPVTDSEILGEHSSKSSDSSSPKSESKKGRGNKDQDSGSGDEGDVS